MNDLTLGFPQSAPLSQVVENSFQEITKKNGMPRRLNLKCGSIEMEMSSTERLGDFDRLLLLSREGKEDELRSRLGELNGRCSVTTMETGVEVKYQAEPGEDHARLKSIMDTCGVALRHGNVWHVSGDLYQEEEIQVDRLFEEIIRTKASDIHLEVNKKPILRIDNELGPSNVYNELSASQIEALLKNITTERQFERFQKEQQISFNFHLVGMCYARVSAFYKKGAVHLTFRYLPEKIPTFKDLNLPEERLKAIAEDTMGLYLIAGVTGSGKTTTLASIIEYINCTKKRHILTIEDPIEYVFEDNLSVVSQREVGVDVPNFFVGVEAALRHDPDIIVLGELKDADTIRAAVAAASTGHLVFGTMHLMTVAETVSRIVSYFDPSERDLIRLQLRDSLRGVICQRLLPKIGGGRIPAVEMLVNDHIEIYKGIEEGNTERVSTGVQQETTSRSFCFEKYITAMIKNKLITQEIGFAFATDKSRLNQMLIGTYKVPKPEGLRQKDKGKE